MNNSSIEYVALFSCFLIDLPDPGESDGLNCSIENPNVCMKCHHMASFLSGESIKEVGGTGHLICFIIWIFIILVGELICDYFCSL